MNPLSDSICDVHGILVGHAHDNRAKTGCTVILAENGAVGGIDIRGSAPGTREIETLMPVRLVPKINALLLTGGSAFGLDASGGVQQFLEERGVGFDVGVTTVPIVPSAVIFDLREGDAKVRPDKKMGYAAAEAASKERPREGRVGVGCGATVGKVAGQKFCMKGGVATLSEQVGDVFVGVLVVVNAFGDVVDNGDIVAGARDEETGQFFDSENYIKKNQIRSFNSSTNTTLAVVATNSKLTKEEATKMAQMANDGLARVIRPSHTMYDGDLVFGLSLGEKKADVNMLGTVAANLVAGAIVRAVKIANDLV